MKRPIELLTKTVVQRTGCGKAYVTVTLPESEYKEIFAVLGKSGGCAACNMSTITRMITLAWNGGMALSKIIKQMDGATCQHSGGLDLSCPQAIANVLKEQLPDKKKGTVDQSP